MGRERGWTPERELTLQTMWAEGHSCSVIAAALGNISRNGVIGKVCRMKLPSPESKQRAFYPKPPSIEKLLKIQKLGLIATPAPLLEAPTSLNLTIEALGDSVCRYPFGLRAPYSYCGHAPKPGSVYCHYHHRLCRPLAKPILRRA